MPLFSITTGMIQIYDNKTPKINFEPTKHKKSTLSANSSRRSPMADLNTEYKDCDIV